MEVDTKLPRPTSDPKLALVVRMVDVTYEHPVEKETPDYGFPQYNRQF